jgi:hypothetical protein
VTFQGLKFELTMVVSSISLSTTYLVTTPTNPYLVLNIYMHNGVMVIIGSFYQPIIGLFQQNLVYFLNPQKMKFISPGVNSTKFSHSLGKKCQNSINLELFIKKTRVANQYF